MFLLKWAIEKNNNLGHMGVHMLSLDDEPSHQIKEAWLIRRDY